MQAELAEALALVASASRKLEAVSGLYKDKAESLGFGTENIGERKRYFEASDFFGCYATDLGVISGLLDAKAAEIG